MEEMSGMNLAEEQPQGGMEEGSLAESQSSMGNLSEAGEQVDQQIDQTAQEQEYDYTTDERFKRMWANERGEMDISKFSKSYRNAELRLEELKPFESKFNDLTTSLNDNGIDPNNLSQYVEEYNYLKDPSNPRNQDMQVLESFMGVPEYEQRIGNFFRELQVENLQRQFPGMNDQQIQEQVQMKEKLSQLEQAEQQRNYQAQEKEYLNVINDNTDKMVKFAKDRGFDVSDEIKNDVLKHCMDNNIPGNAIFATFLDKYGEKVWEAQENKMRDNYTKGISKTDKTKVPSGIKKAVQRGTSSADNKARLRDTLSGYLKR